MFTANNSEEGYSDVSAPEIVLNGEVESLQIGIGETVNVPAAYAYDVLCGITGVTVRVTDPSGATGSFFTPCGILSPRGWCRRASRFIRCNGAWGTRPLP